MALKKVYSITTNGSMLVTGNTLGLSGARIDGQQIGSIRAFSTLNLASIVPGYAQGTTLNWQENESQAVLNIPSGSTVKYARLQWGGTEIAASAGNVTSSINTTITLTTPLGSNTIYPDPLTNDFYGFTTAQGLNQYYSRSQDITSIIQAAGSGVYSVKGVPAVVAADSNAVTCAGWSLGVIYELDNLPYRNMSIFSGISGTNGTVSSDVDIYGFRAPSSGIVEGRLLITAIEGDSGIAGDQFLFGPSSSNLAPLSGPNNLSSNFFASQINNGDSESPTVGALNTTGTFGTLNSTPGVYPVQGLRQGWDITNVKSTNFANGQNSATIRISTGGDAYAVPLIGVQLDSVEPKPFVCGPLAYRVWAPNTSTNSSFDFVNLVTGESQTLSNNLEFNINAIGYNPQDNLIYGIISGTNQLVLIDSEMSVINYGPVENLPVSSYTLGAINSSGYMFIRNSLTQTFYVIDVNQSSPNFGELLDPTNGYTLDTAPYGTNLNSNIVMEDWTFNATDGNLYGYNTTNSTISKITPTGTVTNLITTGLPTGNYSSVYSISDGYIYAINSLSGIVYRITITGNNAIGEAFSQTSIKVLEDGASCLKATLQLDFGDAPDTSSSNGTNNYSTFLSNNGPRHIIVSDLRLGAFITADSDGRQNINATGDDIGANIQDDGIVTPLPNMTTIDTTYTVSVLVNNQTTTVANLYAWLDFNQDGIFESGESFETQVSPLLGSQVVSMSFTRPSGYTTLPGNTFLRVRITTDSLVNTGTTFTQDTRSIGPASDGEVEDYILQVNAVAPICQVPSIKYTRLNQSINGIISTIDPQGQILTYTVDVPPSDGIVNLNAITGEYSYTPVSGYLGSDNFTVLVTNESNLTCTALVTIYVNEAIINIEKSTDKSIAKVGDNIVYDIVVTNTGNVDATNIIITDLLQNETSYVLGSLLVNGGPSSDIVYEGVNIGTLSSGSNAKITFEVKVNDLPVSQKVNNTPVGDYKFIYNPELPEISNHSIGNTTTVDIVNPLLTIQKITTAEYANLNQIYSYILFIKNEGNIDLNNVLITDIIPNGLEYKVNSLTVDGISTGEEPSNGINLGTVAIGTTITISFNVEVTSKPNTNPILNSAASTYNYLINPLDPPINGNATSNTVSTEVRFADLESAGNIIKTVNDNYSQIGDIISYTISVINTGNVNAQNVVVTDIIPNGGIYLLNSLYVNQILSPDDPNSGINIGILEPNNPTIITFNVEITSIPIPNPMKNKSTVSYDYILDPINGVVISKSTDSNTADTLIQQANLIISKICDKEYAAINEVITYVLIVENIGNVNATNVILIDIIQDGLIYNPGSITVNGVFTGEDPNNEVNIGTIEDGSSVIVIFSATVNKIPDTNPIVNIANATYEYYVDPNEPIVIKNVISNSKQTTINSANLLNQGNFIKTENKTISTVGDTIIYTIILKNTGNISAQNIILTDIIPPQTQYVESSLTINGVSSSDIPNMGIMIDDILPDNEVIVEFSVEVISLPTQNPISNTAHLYYTNKPDPTGPDVSAQSNSNTVIANILSPIFNNISKSQNKQYSYVGDIVTYTINLDNSGNIEATNVVLTDLLSPNLTFINGSVLVNGISSPDNPTSGIFVGTLPVGQVNVSFDAKINSIPDPNIINNEASISYNYTINPNNPNGESGSKISNEVSLEVNSADLQITKSSNKLVTINHDTILYILEVINTGNANATDVIVYDQIPQGTVFKLQSVIIDNAPDISASPQDGISLGNIAPNQTVVITFEVNVVSDAIDLITNIATASYKQLVGPDIAPIDRGAVSNELTIENITEIISISKTADRNNATVGDIVKYTLTVSNNSPTNAYNINIQDVLDLNLEYMNNLMINGISSDKNITSGMNIGNIVIGQIIVITFDVKVIDMPSDKIIPNNATASYEYEVGDPITRYPFESSSNLYTMNIVEVGIESKKTADKYLVEVGDSFVYTMTVSNTNEIDINNVIVMDTLPSGFNVVAIQVDGVTVSGNLNAGIDIDDLAVNQSKVVTVDILVASEPDINPFTNIVVFEGTAIVDTIIGPVSINTQAQAPNPTTVVNASIKTNKLSNISYSTIDDIVTYTINVENDGNIDLDNVILNDFLPDELVFINNSVRINNIRYPNESILSGVNLNRLTPGMSKVVQFDARVVSDVTTTVSNIANIMYSYTLTSSGPIYTKEVESNLAVLNIQRTSLDIIKESSTTVVGNSEEFIYTITITNTGDVDIVDAIFKDNLPGCMLQFINGSFTLGLENIYVTKGLMKKGINIGSIAAGESKIIKFKVKVRSNNCTYKNKYTISNKAQVLATYKLEDNSIRKMVYSSNIVDIDKV